MVKCTKDFVQGEYRLCSGETYSGPQAVEDWMLSSYPAHFEKCAAADVLADVPHGLVDELEAEAVANELAARVEVAEFEAPPAHKMVKRPTAKK
jgi:hypothetical protein